MNQSKAETRSVVLSGVDGGNPLGFLAALGTLAVLDDRRADARPTMDWVLAEGAWRPRVHAEGLDSPQALIDRLVDGFRSSESATLQVWETNARLPYPAVDFHALSVRCAMASCLTDRRAADLVAALGADGLTDKEGNFADTSLRMVRSADSGGKGLCAYATWIVRNTTADQLQQLFDSHAAALDEGTSLRWDPSELRTRALQWGDPSKEAVRSRRGLNRCALEALSFFTTVPVGLRAVTVGLSKVAGRQGLAFTWPIWTVRLSRRLIGSLLTLDTLSQTSPNTRELRARGVAAVFRSMRFASSKYYSNFSPSTPV